MFFGLSSITKQTLLHCIKPPAQIDCSALCICLQELILVNKSDGPPSFSAKKKRSSLQNFQSRENAKRNKLTITADIHSSALSPVPPTKSECPRYRYPCLNSVTILLLLSLTKQWWMPQVCGAKPAWSPKRRLCVSRPLWFRKLATVKSFCVSHALCLTCDYWGSPSPQPLLTHHQYKNWKCGKWEVCISAEANSSRASLHRAWDTKTSFYNISSKHQIGQWLSSAFLDYI